MKSNTLVRLCLIALCLCVTALPTAAQDDVKEDAVEPQEEEPPEHIEAAPDRAEGEGPFNEISNAGGLRRHLKSH